MGLQCERITHSHRNFFMHHNDDMQSLQSCKVVAVMAMLYSPVPTLVLAAILHT